MSKPKAKARVFVPLTKVDEEQRLVYGRITQEQLDKAGEVMDYATSKPNFEKWSQEIEAASGGLSKGNVRVMHGLTAAGKLTELNFDDEEKAIDVCAKVVDDQEWEKVVEGVYTGFSVGGSYGKRWTETTDAGAKMKKYEAKPNEVSLVDNPCVYSATFSMTKADGSVVEVEFKEIDEEWPGFAKAEGADDADDEKKDKKEGEDDAKDGDDKKVEKAAPTNFIPSNMDVAKRAEDLQKAAGDATKDWMDYIPTAREQLIAEHTASLGKSTNAAEGAEATSEEVDAAEAPGEAAAGDGSAVSKTTAPGISQKWVTSDGQSFEKKADAEAHEGTLTKAEESDAERLRKALLIATGQVEAAEVAAEGETVFTDLDRMHKAFVELDQPREEDGAPKLEKGMYTVSRFARMIGDVNDLTRTIKAEGVLEGDDGEDENVAKTLKSTLATFGDNFLTYAKQQVAELLKGLDTDVSPACCYDYYYRAAQDDSENQLAKDVCSLIESVKDDLGDAYDPSPDDLAKRAPVGTDEEVVPLAKFQKLEGEYADLKKVTEDAIDQLGGLAKRVAVIEEQPVARAPTGKVVGKEGDTTVLGKTVSTDAEKLAVVQELIKIHGTDGLATLLIKAAQANPQTMGGGR